MELKNNVQILLLGSLFQLIAPACQFPDQLRGQWASSDRGEWTFINDTAVQGIKSDVPGFATMDFVCIDQVGSTYLLQAEQFINIFGKIIRWFVLVCWSIMEIADDMFKYYSQTEYDNFMKDSLYATNDRIDTTIHQACNRSPNATEIKSFNIIVTSLENRTAARACPVELHDVFSDVTFTRDGLVCGNNSMDGYRDERKLIFSSPSCSIGWSGEYLCMYHVESDNGMTYLSVWNNGSHPDSNFSCIAYRKEGNRIHATGTSMFCSANLTEDDPNYYRRDRSNLTEIIFAGAANAATPCTFPEGLKGVWITSDNGVFRINSSALHGYPVNIPGLRTLDLTCEHVQDTKYVLRSVQQTIVFGQTVNMFLCLDIRPSQDNYVYYVGTEFESFLNDALLGSINSTVTIAQVCNRAEPFEGSSAVILVKNTSSIQGIPCPASILFTYDSISVVQGNNVTYCPQSRLDLCEDATHMHFDIRFTCGTAIETSADFSCLYYVENGNKTYLYMETDDRNMMALQHSIVCAEIDNFNGGMTVEMYAEYCNDLMTADPILSLQLASKEKCHVDPSAAATTPASSPNPGDRSFSIYFVIGGVIVLCIAIAVIIVIVISRQKMCFQCRLQPQLPESGQQFTDLNL